MTVKQWDFEEFKEQFKKRTSLDLNSYKQRQMERRIRQLMEREGCPGFYDFYRYLVDSDEAMNHFLTYLTINTSGFFRDEHVYDKLQHHVLPELLRQHSHINIWSAGCSNGEEPYTVAIILEELNALDRASIWASDFDRKALERAQKGVYNSRQVEKVPPRSLQRSFSIEGDNYTIHSRFKKNITFQHQNLLKTFGKMREMHLIFCRNVFIYFKSDVQTDIIERFVNLLVPGGYLVIGCAEYISEAEKFNLERVFSAVYRKNSSRPSSKYY